MGNICRSPAAEGIFRHMASQDSVMKYLHIESCGIGDWFIGNLPDWRMRKTAEKRGFILSSHAQQFRQEFFDDFDYILAADHEVLNILLREAENPVHKAKLCLITAYSKAYRNQEIPDPYTQGGEAFERVVDILEDASHGLIEHLKKEMAKPVIGYE